MSDRIPLDISDLVTNRDSPPATPRYTREQLEAAIERVREVLGDVDAKTIDDLQRWFSQLDSPEGTAGE